MAQPHLFVCRRRKAMLGKGLGDAVRVITPKSEEVFEVVGISYLPPTEESLN